MTASKWIFLSVSVGLVVGCDKVTDSMSGPEFAVTYSTTGSAAVCETISFAGLAHGSEVTSIPTGFGFSIGVSVSPSGPMSTTKAVVYDTDHAGGPDFDLEWQGAGICSECEGLQGVLVIEDARGFAAEGDSPDGGVVTLDGFAGQGTFAIPSFKALDNENVENVIRLRVDGVEIGASTQQGNGSVETVLTTGGVTFENKAEFVYGGSGAVDDLQVCRAEDVMPGRMTGGGVVRVSDINGREVKIRHGFTVHCDVDLSNNLQINWGDNKWHLEKESLEAVSCTDDPNMAPQPPDAPFDTFRARARGTYNGMEGSTIDFVLQDSGEPAGKGDKASMLIYDPDGVVVLDVELDNTESGNIQAHYDQPHRTRR